MSIRKNYKFYDKESLDYTTVLYEFDAPFIENMDNYLKEIYGEHLYAVKLIDHKSRIIRLHSAYDTGKGTVYIKAPKRKKPRKRIDIALTEILNDRKSRILELNSFEFSYNLILIFNKEITQVFKDATVINGYVSGYRETNISSGKEIRYLKNKRFYPSNFIYHSH